MTLAIPIVEKAVVYILRNPVTIYTGHTDANRIQAAADFEALGVGVWVGERPQDDAGDYAITVERMGGDTGDNTDSWPSTERVFIDLTIWGKKTATREKLATLLTVGPLARIILVGILGTVQGVTICGFHAEGDPFQQDEPPNDASDEWVSSYTYPYQVDYTPVTASERIANI